MGFYNPFTYFIKSFIRLFTRKFFWVLLILICVFLGFIIFSPDVKAADSTLYFYDEYFTDADISSARQKIGDTIWNNENYDIFLFYLSVWTTGGSKCYVYYDTSQCSADSYYVYNNVNTQSETGAGQQWWYNGLRLCNDNVDTNVITDFNQYTIYRNDWGSHSDTLGPNSIIGLRQFPVLKSDVNKIYARPIRTHFDIKDKDGNLIAPATNPRAIPPYFITTDTELEQFDFDYLQINGGTTLNSYYFEPLDVVYNADYLLQYRYKGVVTEIDVRPYLTVNNDQTWQINIPYNVLTNYVVVRNGEDFSYRFRYTLQYQTGYDMLKEGTYDLTSQQEQNINEDSDKYVQGEILDQQKETNNKLDDLNNNITNDNVDDVSSEFGDFANDFGAEDNTGIEQIFQKLYDAFCEDSIEDVVITIPFVNKTFTISTDTISSNFPQAIKSIVGVFVWGVIGLWVLKDIRSSINKIAEGSPEDVGSDVKKEVL